MNHRIVVVKVGGSLLDRPGLASRLTRYLESRRPDRVVLVAGGGRFADVLRGLDQSQGLGESRSHALAMRVLDLTAHLLADLMDGLEVVERLDRLPEVWSRGEVAILAPRRFLDRDDHADDPLPHAWTTTTDAIAARVAVRLGAEEIVLLKSAPLPDDCDVAGAARLGLVDPEFPRIAQAIPTVTYLHFRGEPDHA